MGDELGGECATTPCEPGTSESLISGTGVPSVLELEDEHAASLNKTYLLIIILPLIGLYNLCLGLQTIQHASSHIHYSSIFPFSNVLIWRVQCCELLIDTKFFTRRIKITGEKFTSIISAQRLYNTTRLLFNKSFELLKHFKSIRLLKLTQLILVKSSVNIKQYQLPCKDSVFIGPHKSGCTSSILLEALYEFPTENDFLLCLPITHISQNLIDSILGKCNTMSFFFNNFRPLRCK